jgi:hypothetical protein
MYNKVMASDSRKPKSTNGRMKMKSLEKTFAAISSEFPGASNAGLRAKIREIAKDIVCGTNVSTNLLGIGSSVALSATGKSGLEAVNAVFVAELTH